MIEVNWRREDKRKSQVGESGYRKGGPEGWKN